MPGFEPPHAQQDPQMDDYQINIPPSFQAVHTDARGRLRISLQDFRTRYELCEDLSHHLTEHCQGIHVEVGADEQEVLQRCHSGLTGPEAVVSPEEAGWIVTRLSELLSWPAPDWLQPANH